MSTEEIEIPFDCGAAARNKLQVLDAGIPDLHTDSILAVLDDSVVQLQFLLTWLARRRFESLCS